MPKALPKSGILTPRSNNEDPQQVKYGASPPPLPRCYALRLLAICVLWMAENNSWNLQGFKTCACHDAQNLLFELSWSLRTTSLWNWNWGNLWSILVPNVPVSCWTLFVFTNMPKISFFYQQPPFCGENRKKTIDKVSMQFSVINQFWNYQ